MTTRCSPQLGTYYLGKPGGKWLTLVLPDAGYSCTLDEGRVAHTLLGGGSAVQRQAKIRRTWALAFSQHNLDLADKIVQAAYGSLGVGPYAFIDPNWRNALPAHIASAGVQRQTTSGFVVAGTGSALTYDAVTAPPTDTDALKLSGVLAWTPGTTSRLLGVGMTSLTAPAAIGSMPPVSAGLLPVTVGFYAIGAAGVNVTVQAYFYDATGALISSASFGGTLAVTTAWGRYAVTVPAASIPATSATVSFALTAATNTAIKLAGFDAQYVTAAVGTSTTSLADWVLGLGIARVNIGGNQKGDHGGVLTRRSHDLTLLEAA